MVFNHQLIHPCNIQIKGRVSVLEQEEKITETLLSEFNEKEVSNDNENGKIQSKSFESKDEKSTTTIAVVQNEASDEEGWQEAFPKGRVGGGRKLGVGRRKPTLSKLDIDSVYSQFGSNASSLPKATINGAVPKLKKNSSFSPKSAIREKPANTTATRSPPSKPSGPSTRTTLSYKEVALAPPGSIAKASVESQPPQEKDTEEAKLLHPLVSKEEEENLVSSSESDNSDISDKGITTSEEENQNNIETEKVKEHNGKKLSAAAAPYNPSMVPLYSSLAVPIYKDHGGILPPPVNVPPIMTVNPIRSRSPHHSASARVPYGPRLSASFNRRNNKPVVSNAVDGNLYGPLIINQHGAVYVPGQQWMPNPYPVSTDGFSMSAQQNLTESPALVSTVLVEATENDCRDDKLQTIDTTNGDGIDSANGDCILIAEKITEDKEKIEGADDLRSEKEIVEIFC